MGEEKIEKKSAMVQFLMYMQLKYKKDRKGWGTYLNNDQKFSKYDQNNSQT